MATATLVLSTWDMRAGTVDATVEYIVQGRVHTVPVQMTVEEVATQAVLAGRTPDTWERGDVATICSAQMGIQVGIANPTTPE